MLTSSLSVYFIHFQFRLNALLSIVNLILDVTEKTSSSAVPKAGNSGRSREYVDPITYSILRFHQLRGGGLFWPGLRKQSYGYRIDLNFTTINGTDDTIVPQLSKCLKFEAV